MKEAKTEYYVQVQRRKTIKYGETQHHQDYITIPIQLSEMLGLQPKQTMKCTLNGNGNSFTYVKIAEKPSVKKITYQEWLSRIKPYIPTMPPGKNPFEIYHEAGLDKRSVPAIWLERAERDINLHSHVDSKLHKILWYALRNRELRPRKMVDQKLTALIPI